MAKFDYKKWVTENKYGIISEQTGSMTGSMSTGSMSTGSMSTGSVSPKPKPKRKKIGRLREQSPTGSMTGSNSCAEFETYSEELQLQMCDAYEYVLSVGNPPSTYQGLLNIIGQNAECCPTGSMTGSLEVGMWVCKDSVNYPGCQQIANQNQATMATGYGLEGFNSQAECIANSACTGTEATGSFAGGDMTTGSMAQGMPSMTRRPQRRLRENKNLNKNKKMNLKNIKNTIKKALIELNEQKAMGGMDGMARQEYGGLVRCWCGAGESPETCDGVMIGNKVNCTCCGKPVCMDTIDGKGI